MPLHAGKDRTASAAIANIIDYVENPQKTDNGRLIYGYMCDTMNADMEFSIARQQYINLTGRRRGSDDVIAYHLRQAFAPGEVTPEEANQVGQELAMKLTKGNNAFIVCTHIDKHHIQDEFCQGYFLPKLFFSFRIIRQNRRQSDWIALSVVLLLLDNAI